MSDDDICTMLTGFTGFVQMKECRMVRAHGSGMALSGHAETVQFSVADKHATKQFSDDGFPQYDVPLC
jgi:hypothetical protein